MNNLIPPFKIFPSVGYLNSQFQLVAFADEFIIRISYNSQNVYELIANSNEVVLLTKLNSPGIYTATCEKDGVYFKQDFEVLNSYRFGSSEIKSIYTFDNIPYSFIVMKDRLNIYNDLNNNLVTENKISPSNIIYYNEEYLIFLTNNINQNPTITNIALFSIKSLTICDELIDNYELLILDIPNNKIWVQIKSTLELACFKICDSTNKLDKIYSGTNYNSININKGYNAIFQIHEDKLSVINSSTLNIKTIALSSSIAIDYFGNLYTITYNSVKCECLLIQGTTNNFINANEIRLNPKSFLYLGSDLNKIFESSIDVFSDLIYVSKVTELDNKTNQFFYSIPEESIVESTENIADLYLLNKSLFVVTKTVKTNLISIKYTRKTNEPWQRKLNISSNTKYEIKYCSDSICSILATSETTLYTEFLFNKGIFFETTTSKILINEDGTIKHFDKAANLYLEPLAFSNYFLETDKNNISTLFHIHKNTGPTLTNLDVLNYKNINAHKTLWYKNNNLKSSKDIKHIIGLNLVTSSPIYPFSQPFQIKEFHQIKNEFILANENILVHPHTGDILDSPIGDILTVSHKLMKSISKRGNDLYLHKYNIITKRYDTIPLAFDITKSNESYLSPDGNFLMLQNSNNQYYFYEINTNKIVHFFNSTFVSFSSTGGLIFKETKSRKAKIIDPVTFEDITPPNYHYYKITSPDRRLYSNFQSHVQFKDRISNKVIENIIAQEYLIKFKHPSPLSNQSTPNDRIEYEKKSAILKKAQLEYFTKHKDRLMELNITEPKMITYGNLIIEQKYTTIGILNSEISLKIILPPELLFYNYSSFSYNNDYFAVVGKPVSGGLIRITKLNTNSIDTLEVIHHFKSKAPAYACWVCQFSKTGHFATYDSAPNTYIIKCNDDLFNNAGIDSELKTGLDNMSPGNHKNIRNWRFIKGRNFLSFSPSGKYFAMSEQGYDPISLGGKGHTESDAVYIGETETGETIRSFFEHGSKIKIDGKKNIVFVGFSDDEKRFMTMSSDGVVIVRNISLASESLVDSPQDQPQPLHGN